MTKQNKGHLAHYGVLGMKWGRRKGQDTSSSDHKNASSLKSKKVHELSNEQLKTLTKRLNLESEFKRLNPSTKDRMANLASGLINSAVKPVIVSLIAMQVKSVIEKKLGKK